MEVHHWVINEYNVGQCKNCHEVRQFTGADRPGVKNDRLFARDVAYQLALPFNWGRGAHRGA